MSYQIKVNDDILYDSRVASRTLLSAVLSQEMNKAGTLSLTVPYTHVGKNLIQKLSGTITVLRDTTIVFRGRSLNDGFDLYTNKQFTIEGALAYFNDSIVSPYEVSGSVDEYVAMLIDSHNQQVQEDRQFKLGNVTVTDSNDYFVRASSDYPCTWSEMKAKLIDLLGGYLFVRYENDGNYIDYLDDIELKNQQSAEFGMNILDLSLISKGEDIASILIPLGAKDEDGNYLTIESVNEGKKYIENQEAIEKWGRITKTVVYEDVTRADNLLSKGTKKLAQLSAMSDSISITAADLAAAGYQTNALEFGKLIEAKSSIHGLSESILVTKMETDLLQPANNKLTLGKTKTSFTGSQLEFQKKQEKETIKILEQADSKVDSKLSGVYQEIEQSYTNATKTASEIIFEAVSEYAKTSDLEAFKETVSTQFIQSAESVDLIFNQLVEQITNVEGNTEERFNEQTKYIRFIDGSIVIGVEENPLILTLKNDRISFAQNGVEVAYFANNQMYVANLVATEMANLCGLKITRNDSHIQIG